MEAAFAAGMVLLLATVVDQALLGNQFPWLQMTYAILEELISEGHLQAAARKNDLQQLQQVLSLIPNSAAVRESQHPHPSQPTGLAQYSEFNDHESSANFHDPNFASNNQTDLSFVDDTFWRTGFTADQLVNVADTLDLDGIEWMTTGSSN